MRLVAGLIRNSEITSDKGGEPHPKAEQRDGSSQILNRRAWGDEGRELGNNGPDTETPEEHRAKLCDPVKLTVPEPVKRRREGPATSECCRADATTRGRKQSVAVEAQ